MKRTHTCGDLRKKDIKKAVRLCGWNHSRRDHGGIIFIDLRDRYGITQIVFDPKHNKEAHKKAESLGREDVLFVEGKVRARGKGLENPKLKTGEIEVLVNKIEILNKSETPPIEIDSRIETNEDMRLKYRYLDLRKPEMQQNILIRHKAVKAVRDFFDKEGFLEIETPILSKSTPEGARDYLVPSRVHPGKFYALPQSPQLFKQLLMVAGFDKYFQIAKCFRDEDLRADRQPEFTQIDVEMSFVDEEDIFDVTERMLKHVWKEILNIDLKIPFPRITYKEAMEKYGSDKPDTRFELFLVDVSDIVKGSGFKVFTDALKSGGKVKCINAKNCANFSRKDIEELTEFVGIYGAKGLAWMKATEKGLESSIVKFFEKDILNSLAERMECSKGDLLLFVADHKHHVVNIALGQLRLELGRRLGLIDEKKYNFVWVTDFPLVEFDEDEQRHVAIHHPFTSPKDEDLKFLDKDVSKVRSKAYDITLNGVEIGGGSIRIHKREIQEKMFSILGISKEEAEERFGFLLNAFKYGAPPHGGIALGLDRIIAILTGNDSIREVIAFPKNKAAQSLMEDSPSEVDNKQLDELGIKIKGIKIGEKKTT
jgi:aspartyl-tRNA synthetase